MTTTFAAVERQSFWCIFSTIQGDAFTSANVASYSEVPMDLSESGEDYHDADEVFVFGRRGCSIRGMGWTSPEEMVKSLNARRDSKFKAVQG